MAYLTSADLTANFVRNMDVSLYLEEADNEVNDLAERRGVYDTTLIQVPLHYKLKEYAKAFVYMRIARDSLGTNSVDTEREMYRDQYEMYQKELDKLAPQITYEVITGNVENMIGRTAVFNLYRG